MRERGETSTSAATAQHEAAARVEDETLPAFHNPSMPELVRELVRIFKASLAEHRRPRLQIVQTRDPSDPAT